MNRFFESNTKNLKIVHLILGGLFLVGGIVNLSEPNYINGLWYTSLALFFLFDFFLERLKSSFNSNLINAIFYILKAMVVGTGIVAILRLLKII